MQARNIKKQCPFKPYVKAACKLTGLAVLGFGIAGFVAGNVLVNNVLVNRKKTAGNKALEAIKAPQKSTKLARAKSLACDSAPADQHISKHSPHILAAMRESLQEFKSLSLAPRDLFIQSHDGLRLHAHYFEGRYDQQHTHQQHTTAILLHGYKSQVSHMYPYASMYIKRGYNVLIPDLRSHGQSEGCYITMGVHESKDVILWIQLLAKQNPKLSVVLHGVSMGAATTMLVAGQNPKPVKLAIEDCGYTTAWEIFVNELDRRYHLPPFPLLNIAELCAQMRAHFRFTNPAPIEAVTKTTIPLYCIHGSEDDFVPTSMVYKLYETYSQTHPDVDSSEQRLWVVDGAAHAESIFKDKNAYEAFVSSALADVGL